MKRNPCPKCGSDMRRLIAYWRCASCGRTELIPSKNSGKDGGQ